MLLEDVTGIRVNRHLYQVDTLAVTDGMIAQMSRAAVVACGAERLGIEVANATAHCYRCGGASALLISGN